MKNKKMKKDILVLTIIVLITIILLGISFYAYSRFVTNSSGNATAQVVKMICEMEVEKSPASTSVINPYCIVTVKDYNANGTTEADVNYKLEVVAKDNKVLPEFYWKNSSGTIIARSQDILDNQNNVIERTANFPIQSFTAGVRADAEFTIVFLNTGEEDVLRQIDFNLVAVQAGS